MKLSLVFHKSLLPLHLPYLMTAPLSAPFFSTNPANIYTPSPKSINPPKTGKVPRNPAKNYKPAGSVTQSCQMEKLSVLKPQRIRN